MLAAEGDPERGEGGGFRHGFEGEERSAVVGDVAGELFSWVVGGENGEDGVGGGERRFFVWVGGGDEDVDAREVGFFGGMVKKELLGESGEVGGAVERGEFWDLVEEPAEGEPELAHDGHGPEPDGVVILVADAPREKQSQRDQA